MSLVPLRHDGCVKEIGPTRFSTRLTVTADGLRFRTPGQAMILGAFFSFGLALCIGGCASAFTHPHRADDSAEKVALLFIIAVLGWFLVRIVRSGVLIASTSGIVVRDLFRTHRYDWGEVAHFEERVAAIGTSQVPRRFLRVHLADGGFENFTVLNDSRRRNPDVVAELVRHLRDMKDSADTRGSKSKGT